MPNLKRNGPIQQFVSQDSDTPDVNLAVVRLLAHDFRRCVDWSAALSGTQERGVDSPAEVAYFDGVLR